MQLLHVRQNDAAEQVIAEALALWPNQPMNLYNMSCLKALKGFSDEAMALLNHAAAAGFTDFDHIASDPDLQSLHSRADFQQLLSEKPRFLHRAAEAVLRELKHQLGDGYLYEIDDDDKLIFATNTDAVTLAALKKMLVAQARSQHVQLFGHVSDQFITVILPSNRDFAAMITQPGVEGIYDHDQHVLVARGLGFVTQHEFTHAMHYADIEPTEQDHPVWLVEGIAVLFEHAEFESNPSDPQTPLLIPQPGFRLASLQAAAASHLNLLIPWDKLLVMAQPQFVDKAAIAYAESGSIMDYLYRHDQLRKFYDAFKANYDKDRTGRLALEQVTGLTLDALEKDWKQWMLRQKPPAVQAGPDGPYLGARFGPANDGIRIEFVVEAGPAGKAGLHAADLIVGLNDVDVRDVPTLVAMLIDHHPGEEITLHVRRAGIYLQIPVTLGRRTEASSPATRPSSRITRPRNPNGKP